MGGFIRPTVRSEYKKMKPENPQQAQTMADIEKIGAIERDILRERLERHVKRFEKEDAEEELKAAQALQVTAQSLQTTPLAADPQQAPAVSTAS